MKTAEEILNKNYYNRQDPEVDMDTLIDIINEARIEAIKECAENANLQIQSGYGTLEHKYSADIQYRDVVERTIYGHGDSGYEIITINHQSILNLINQVK